MAAERNRRNRNQETRRGSVVGRTDDEETLVGQERAGDVRDGELVRLRQIRRVQDRTLVGLLVLAAEVTVLGALAMVGVGLGWFDSGFATQVLVITLSPSFTAWLLVTRYAFRRGG